MYACVWRWTFRDRKRKGSIELKQLHRHVNQKQSVDLISILISRIKQLKF